jgi:hypothetical protein
MNPVYSLIKLRQSHHYYHHFSTLMVLLVYGYLVYLIVAALTITFLYFLSCKAISHTRIVALVLFPRWYKCLVCVELYQWLIELERIFILPLASRWVRHSYLSKRLHTIPYTCGISSTSWFFTIGFNFPSFSCQLLSIGCATSAPDGSSPRGYSQKNSGIGSKI